MAYNGPRALLFLILIFFFLLSPDTRSPTVSRMRDLDEHISVERAALHALNSSDYNAFDPGSHRWLNITGFRRDDGLAWNILPVVKERSWEQTKEALFLAPFSSFNNSGVSQDEEGIYNASRDNMADSVNPFKEDLPMYSNVTSVLRGQWVRSKLDIPQYSQFINLSSLLPSVSWATRKYNRNITGIGGELRVKLTEHSDEEVQHNPHLTRMMKAEMVIKDKTSSGDGWEVVMYGVHFVRQGSIILSTTSEKFAGIFALPHFARTEEAFSASKALLVKSNTRIVERQNLAVDPALNPWSSVPHSPGDSMFPTPYCELVAYLQQRPSDGPNEHPFKEIEDELRYPRGRSLSQIPQIHMNALLFSPDCGFVLESKGPPEYTPTRRSHLIGRKIEAYMKEARHCVLAFALLVSIEVFLLKQQMNEASTPSTKSRISFYTIIMMALGDGFACMSFLVAGMFVDVLYLPLVATAFLSFLCVSFFGMKFLMDIWNVQAPERQERERELQRQRAQRNAAPPNQPATTESHGSVDTVPPTASSSDTLPLPATANRGGPRSPTPVIITPDQDLDAAGAEDAAAPPANNADPTTTAIGSARREMGALYSRFYFVLLSILFLSLHATSWPSTLRSLYCNVLSFTYLSLWIPQIYRNIMRNCRKALSWRFVIGESILRVAPFAYFYTWDDNILFVDPDSHALFVLVGWVWLQIFLLATQEAVGPRMFVPENWVPKAYDYHPLLREGDRESGGNMPIGFTEAIASPTSPVATSSSAVDTQRASERRPKKNEDGNKRRFDCAICTETFDVPFVPAGGEGRDGKASVSATTIFARRAYMVTPCRHIFHSTCLEGWMRYRLQCPICREGLPPL